MSVHALVRVLLQSGEAPNKIREVLGTDVTAVHEPTHRGGTRQVFALWEHAARVLQRRSLAVHVASHGALDSWHPLGLLASAAPTGGRPIEAAVPVALG